MPLSDLIQPTTEDYIKHFSEANPGPDAEDAFKAAQMYRNDADRGKTGAQRDLNLRNAEHALFVQSQVDQRPVMGRLGALLAVPGYAAAKVATKNGIAPATIKALTGADASSTTPDLRELYWGLRPVFQSVKPGASSQPAGRGPDPEHP